MKALGLSFRRSIISISILLLFFLPGCDLLGGKKFSVTFNDLNGLKENNKVYIYPANIAVGKVDFIGVFQGKAEVFIELGRKYPASVTMDSYFFIDSDPMQPSAKCILVSVPEKPEMEVVTQNKRLSGIDSWLQWTMITAEKQMSPAISEFLHDYSNRLNEWYEENLKTLSDRDWDRLGDDIKNEMHMLYDQAKELAKSECAEKSLETLNNNIENLRKKIENLSGSKEAEQLRKSLEEMLDRLEDELGVKKSASGLAI